MVNKAGKWSCDQSGKLSNRTSTSAGEVGTPVAVVVMKLDVNRGTLNHTVVGL